MNDDPSVLPYRYDPGEHPKHCGREPQAHFRGEGNAVIGVCPSTLSKEEAERLLRHGAPDISPGAEHPARIYAVHEGVVYEARPTVPGVSYHGFPWRGRPNHNRLPRPIKRALRTQAERAGYLDAFNQWLDQYES